MLRHCIGSVAALVIPTLLVAQRPRCPTPVGDTAALAPSEVEQPPVADSANLAPRYPELLRQAGIGGLVRVTFVVDTGGRPERVVIVQSPNPGFDVAVKRAVATWRYAPASHCGHGVRVRLRHEFAFQPTPPDTSRIAQLFEDDATGLVCCATPDTVPDGTPRTTIRWRPAAPVARRVAWDSTALDSAEEVALAELMGTIGTAPSGMARVVCLMGPGGAGSDPDSGRLVRLTRPGVAVLPFRRCPPTFVSMIYTPGERPHPPGEDPYAVQVRTRTGLSPTRVLFEVDVSQSAGGRRYLCGVERRDGGWRVRCLVVSSWVS